ncbi:tol-pal system protein YbgF [Gemmatimonas sp.]|jgi:tol-pal system protein YbgF|uniref:tol-pal system protein YbgF n=1 Tax=Gemmatimonas sp. TaxID=1962908 RepID=UPI0037C0452B
MFQRFPRRVWRLFPLVALAATGGCFATRGDVRIVQADIATLRTELVKAQQEQKDALLQTQRMIQLASDSLARVSARTVGLQGDVREGMRAVREQLLQVQTLLGQSQATIARLRAEMEARNALPVVAPAPAEPQPTAPTRGGRAASSPLPPAVDTTTVLPGPNQLYTTGRDQLLRGATATARTTFQELITNYPQSDYASDAQFWIAESLAKENNVPAADAAYAAVVSAYPTSPKAPTALYKRAQLVLKQGITAQARQLFEQVVSRYPRSDEAELAAETLKTLR